MDNHRNPGRVNELTVLKADQDVLALFSGPGKSLRELRGNREIELTLDLDLPTLKPKISFGESENPQMRH
ncbi:MAG TPA: hypothetical protein VN758_08935 [Solirubrobacterales bacterium]|nr:hypothetical protein [Solirubrobacterales bacterium]